MGSWFDTDIEPGEFTRLADIAQNLVYRLPGCSDLMVRKTIQEVYREFCRDTKFFQLVHRGELKSGEAVFGVAPLIPGGVVGEVREVSIGHIRLRCGVDYTVEGISPVTVVLAPSSTPSPEDPEARAHISVLAVEYPSMGSEEVPQGFVDAYGDAIASGVMARLCSMANKPWSDMQVAAAEQVRYQNAKSEARMRREVPPDGRIIDTSEIL